MKSSKFVFVFLSVSVVALLLNFITASAHAQVVPPGYFALDIMCNEQFTARTDGSNCVDMTFQSFRIYATGYKDALRPVGIESFSPGRAVNIAYYDRQSYHGQYQQCQMQQQQYAESYEPTRLMYFFKGLGVQAAVSEESLLANLSAMTPDELKAEKSFAGCRIARRENLLIVGQQQVQQQQSGQAQQQAYQQQQVQVQQQQGQPVPTQQQQGQPQPAQP